MWKINTVLDKYSGSQVWSYTDISKKNIMSSYDPNGRTATKPQVLLHFFLINPSVTLLHMKTYNNVFLKTISK